MNRTIRSQIIWLPLSWTILTQILLSLPGSLFDDGNKLFNIPHLDKIAHLILFGGLCLLWNYFLYRKSGIKSGAMEWVVVVLTASYGIVLEYFQFHFIPQRSFDKGDIVADAVGSLIGYGITQWIISWHDRRKGFPKEKPL